MLNSLDMRIPVTIDGIMYLIPYSAADDKADIQLPDGTLFHVVSWEGSVFKRVGRLEILHKPTPGTKIVQAVVHEQRPTGTPDGAMN